MGNLAFQELLFIAVILTAIIATVLYCITLQNALQAVSPHNRKMKPGNVWLLFIPFFNLVWNFIVVDAIASSFQKEYERFGVVQANKPTYRIGLTMAILQAASLIPVIGIITSLASIVCLIIYWLQVNKCKNELIQISFSNTI